MGFSMYGFGLIVHLPSKGLIITVAVLFRATQGFASSIIQTSSYAIVAVTFPNNTQEHLAILEAAIGFGLVAGPVIGSALYSMFSFSVTFYVIAGVFMVSAIFLYFFMPNSMNQSEVSKLFGNQVSTDSVNIWDLLCHRVFLCCSIAAFFGYFVLVYFEPILSIRLIDMGLTEFWIGVFFSINGIGNIFASFLLYYFSGKFDNKLIILSAMIIAGLSQFMVGPSIFFPDSIWIMAIGHFIMGMFTPFFQVSSLPEMINVAKSKYPNNQDEASDISSGVFNSMLGFGQMIAPLYGSYATDVFGFRQ